MTISPEIQGDQRTTARQLWSEWRGEIAACLRERFAGWRDDRTFMRLDIAPDEIALARVGAQGVQILARATPGEHGFGSLAAAIPDARTILDRTRDVVIRFGQPSILRLYLDLPYASPSLLRKAVTFELEQVSPIGPDRLYFDFATTKVNAQAKIELRAIKRVVVDEAVALCHASKLGVAAIVFEGDDHEADWRAFPVDRFSFLRRQWARAGAGILAGVAVLLFVAVLAAVTLRGAEEDGLLLTQLADVNEQASVVHRLQQKIRDLHTQIEFPAAQKRAPLLVDVLAQLTKALPDGTWLTEFAIKDGRVHVRGFSKSASDLIGDIDQSPTFANAQFSAPLEGAQDGTERFDLTFDVKQAVRP